jgi:hypothetical protein
MDRPMKSTALRIPTTLAWTALCAAAAIEAAASCGARTTEPICKGDGAASCEAADGSQAPDGGPDVVEYDGPIV